MNKKYRKYIDNLVENTLKKVLRDEKIYAGHNGPYYDKEFAGRNISHWICTFGEFYIKTGYEKYKIAVEKLSKYYVNNYDFINGVYNCRDSKNKDHINGTIGNAWIIQGLVYCTKVLNNDFFINRAISIFKNFTFDKKNGMWNRIDIDKKNLGLDITYNHQLWFAAAGTEILNIKYDEEIFEMINIFLDKSKRNFCILYNGLIYHFANNYNNLFEFAKNKLKFLRHNFEIFFNVKSLEYKEIGYHMFNLYGFSIIYKYFNENIFFKNYKIKKAYSFCTTQKFKNSLFSKSRTKDVTNLKSNNVALEMNTYAFPYNSPAFEWPFIQETFENFNYEMADNFMNYQFDKTFNVNEMKFLHNTEDVETLNSRIYELVRSNYFWSDNNDKKTE